MGEPELHLSAVCRHFARVLPNHEPFPNKFPTSKDPDRSLVRAIVFQQLSGKAAGTIHGRTLALSSRARTILTRKTSWEHRRSCPLQCRPIAPEDRRAQGRFAEAHRRHHSAAALAAGEAWQRRDHRAPDRGARCRPLDRRDVSDFHARPARRAAGRRSRRAQGRRETLRAQLHGEGTRPKYGQRWAPWRSAAAWHLWRYMDTLVVPE